MAINVGSVEVSVVPDARQFNTKMAEIARNASVMVKVDADTREAHARIDDLSRNRDATVGVDVDDVEAKAKLDELTRSRDATLNVNADTGAADAKLAALGNSANNSNSGMSALMKTAIALSPALVPVAAAATGVAAALGAMGAAGIAGAGVLTIALGGVTNAVKLLGQQQQQQQAAALAAGQSAAAHAQAIVAAQRQMQSAEMSLADARRSAADTAIQDSQAVASAQYALQQADQAETNAVNALVAAREAASRQLESYANAAVDTRLAEQQAVLDLETAQRNYNVTMASATATQQQRQQAALDLAKAQQRIVETQQAATNAAQDNAKAQKLGVDGAPQVVSATQAVAAAQHNQQQAAQNLADAQRKAAEDQVKSQEAIVRAEQGVAAAADAMAAAQRNAAGTTNTALAATNAQIAALDPATRNFAGYLRGTWAPIWHQIQTASAGGLLPGVQAGMDAIRPLMPQFIAFIRDLSQRMGDLAKTAGQALGGPFWQQFFGFVSRVAGPSLSTLGRILGDLVTGFAGLLMAFEPIITPMVDGMGRLADKFAAFGTQASTNAGFGRFIGYIRDNMPLVGDVVKNILKAVGEAVAGLAPLGHVLLQVLDSVAKFLADKLIPFLTPIVRFIVDQVAPVFREVLAKAIDGARVAFGWIMDAIKANRPELEQLWTFIKNDLAPVIGFVLKVAFELLGKAIGFVIDIISVLVDIWNHMWELGKSIGHWFANDFVGFFVGAWNAIRDGWRTLVTDIKNLWQDIEHWVMVPVAWVVQYVINDGLIKAWDWISDHLLGGALHANPMDVPNVPPLAASTGLVVPGYAPGVDSVHAILSPGEGVLVPEAVRGLGGAAAIHAINSAYSSRVPSGNGRFAGGGIVDSIIGALVPGAGLAEAIGGQKMTAIIDDPLHAVSNLVKTIMSGIGQAGPFIDMLGQALLGMAKGVGNALLQAIQGSSFAGLTGLSARAAAGLPNMANLSPGMFSGSLIASLANRSLPGGGGAAQWRGVVDQVLAALGLPISVDNGVLNIIQHESGGNPNAINLTDSNALAGHPSQGLMQTIPSTFYAYAGPYASLGITNPFANVYAGVNYAYQRYGLGMLAAGGRSSGGHYIGYDAGGWLPTGPSLVYNGTGQPELIAPRQTFEQVMSGATGGASLQGLRIVGTLDLGDGLEGRIDGRIDEVLTVGTQRLAYN